MLFNVQQSGKSRAKMEGVEDDVVIDGHLAEFRAEAIDTQQLSELEETNIRLLPPQTEVVKEKLANPWPNFKVPESAVPLRVLASDALLHGTRARDDSKALWAKIQAVTVQKRQFCVQRRIGIFLKSLKLLPVSRRSST